MQDQWERKRRRFTRIERLGRAYTLGETSTYLAGFGLVTRAIVIALLTMSPEFRFLIPCLAAGLVVAVATCLAWAGLQRWAHEEWNGELY